MDDTAKPQDGSFRTRLAAWLETPLVRNGILVIIIINAISLGMGTSETITSRIGGFLDWFDRVVLGIFVVEIALKLIAYRMAFFKSVWNLFDLFVVVIGLLPQSDGLSALRGLRVIRAMRLFHAVPAMRAVVQALLDALPGMGAVVAMLSIIYYVFAVMATIMYGDKFDEWFGTVGRSAYSLFQIMTLESWSMGIVRPVMKEFTYAWAFFVPFITITAFSVLNLFIGLLVTTMESAVESDTDEEFERLRDLVKAETDLVDERVKALQEEIRGLREDLAAARGGGD